MYLLKKSIHKRNQRVHNQINKKESPVSAKAISALTFIYKIHIAILFGLSILMVFGSDLIATLTILVQPLFNFDAPV
jgi:hypothetical protein